MQRIGLLVGLIFSLAVQVFADPYASQRKQAEKRFNQGNYQEAYDLYRQFLGKPDIDPNAIERDLNLASVCLSNLGQVNKLDGYLEDMVAAYPDNWRALQKLGVLYSTGIAKHGYLIAGKFERGNHRGGGKIMHAAERDRVIAFQLFRKAEQVVLKQGAPREIGKFYYDFASVLSNWRNHGNAWRLQGLTDLTVLPDYEEGYGHSGFGRYQHKGAPATADGKPVFHALPESWESAKSDGERWRWLLQQAAEAEESFVNLVKRQRADFLHHQFGVQTMAHAGFSLGETAKLDGPFALPTLKDNETIARLASGIKRFTLPEEYNFIRMYKELAAHYQLGAIYLNRMQFPEAAVHYKKCRQLDQLEQIVGEWGQFESTPSQRTQADGAKVGYRFRNGKAVSFTAREIDIEDLIADIEQTLKSKPKQLDWHQMNIGQVGYQIIHRNEDKYVGKKVADWKLKLKPRAKHFDRSIMVDVPIKKPGAYLITARMQDGNESNMVLWLNDTVIVKKKLASTKDKGSPAYFFVADAATGKPIADAKLRFFGYWQEYVRPKVGRGYQKFYTTEFQEETDALGQVMPSAKQAIPDANRAPQYLVTARTKGGRFAFLGFSRMWFNTHHDQAYHATRSFVISDRPVYRPNQTAQFKAWVRKAQYDMKDESSFAGSKQQFVLYNPKNEIVFKRAVSADEFGGVVTDWAIPDDAPLGVYRLQCSHGSLTFRVEEYKKPEFEVTIDAPVKPVKLGDQVPVTVEARYLFGAPVTQGKVKYKVMRTEHDSRWYPVAPWDWLYGKGYWWYGYDYPWYPGWRNWGCIAPYPSWWRQAPQPPELVTENEVAVGADGRIKILIDTALAKEMHGDQDHKYQITAEVTDESRRTIVGAGSIIVAREPFKVYAWLHRGYYRSGDQIKASFNAQTVDGKPIKGTGVARLYLVKYKGELREPVEKEIESWKLDPAQDGRAELAFKATRAGQYRLAYTVSDDAGNEIEGAVMFVVRGEKLKHEDARFNELELIADKASYASGEEVALMINTDHEDATVVLFLRPSNGVYLPPKVLNLEGKSAVETITVAKKDMPNFFVEAFTVVDGKVFSQTREIVVPPEKRVVSVEVLPSEERYLPGEEARMKVVLRDLAGKPFVGTTVLSVYDKAVEYISGGSNVGDIKSFFWKWRRTHYPHTEHSASFLGSHLRKPSEVDMAWLGVFGHLADAVPVGSDKQQIRRARTLSEGSAIEVSRGQRSLSLQKAAPAAAMAPGAMAVADFARTDGEFSGIGGGGGGAAGDEVLVAPTVRRNFADTAYWTGSLNTDKLGVAEVRFTMPENLSGWKVKAWAMGHGTRVGEGSAEVVTAKNVLVRLQAPRFFVEKDEVVISGNIHNYLDEKKQVTAKLDLKGSCLEHLGNATQSMVLDAQGEKRVDWRVRVLREGEAVIQLSALTDVESDAMEMKFPVYVHGMLKTESYSGVLRPDEQAGVFSISVPVERRVDETRLEIRYSPTLAGAMVDALPYLADYPYGCTEQTLSRFLPAVMTQKVLLDMGIDLQDVKNKRANLNAQEIGNDIERAAQWQRFNRNPVFDEDKLADMVRSGVKRLASMQLRDGGWGWFSGVRERSSAHTTAYVVHGLQIAVENGVTVKAGMLRNGVDWLKRHQVERIKWIQKEDYRRPNNLDAFVFMVLADAEYHDKTMHKLLYEHRTDLAVYAKAMLGLAMHRLGENQQRDMLIRNIEQFVQRDAENQTAWLNLGHEGYWWYWYGSEYEAHAYYLKLLNKVDPKGETAPALVKYLLNNRKHATYWNSTRDTAICLEAFAEFLRASGENKPDFTLDVLVDGRKVKEVPINKDNLFTFDNKVVLTGNALSSGEHKIEFRKQGQGPLYYNAYLTNFTLEDQIERAGLEVKVNRTFYLLKPIEKTIQAQGAHGQVVDQRVEKYERLPVANGDSLKSGDLVEIELEIDSKNDYEYLVFEDMKAAGFEPVDVRSGYNGNEMRAYVEFRDEKVAFFVRQLARGKHSVSYRVRAEIPGKFSALPTRAEAMYAPELKANSDELKVSITD